MGQETDNLIAGLVEDLAPRRPLRFSRGIALAVAALGIAVGLALLRYGLRPDLAAGHPHVMFILGGGIFFLLGSACTAAVVSMSSPRVGTGRNGWGWAAAAASLLPLTALVAVALDGETAWLASEPSHGVVCLGYSLALGLITAGALVLWLRKGAPTSPDRAGLLTGIAAGCAGVVAFTFACPFNSIMHVGLWHGLAVTISALAGRLVVPRLIRW